MDTKCCPKCGKVISAEMRFCPYCMEKFYVKNNNKKNLEKFVPLYATFIFAIGIIVVGALLIIPKLHGKGNLPSNAVPLETTQNANNETEETTKPNSTVDIENLVTNAYTYGDETSYNIPKINLDYPEIENINNEIFSEYYLETPEGNTYDFASELGYEWFVYRNKILSLIIKTKYDNDYEEYGVYNINILTGEKLTDNELISTIMSEDEYKIKVKEAVCSRFWEQWGDMISSWTAESNIDMLNSANERLTRTISYENIENCRPYLGKGGSLYVICKIFSLAGADIYNYSVNVSKYTLATNYAETINVPDLPRFTIPYSLKTFFGKTANELFPGVQPYDIYEGSYIYTSDNYPGLYFYFPIYMTESGYNLVGIDGSIDKLLPGKTEYTYGELHQIFGETINVEYDDEYCCYNVIIFADGCRINLGSFSDQNAIESGVYEHFELRVSN